MKLVVSEQMYERIQRYHTMLDHIRKGKVLSVNLKSYWEVYLKEWEGTLSPLGLTAYYRFLEGDDSVIVVKTEPSPTTKDSLESLANKVDDIGDVIKGVVRNLEKNVIPDNEPEYIVKFNEKGITTEGFMYNVPTERYVSKVTFGNIELSRDLNKAVVYSSREEANELAKELNGSLNKLGLPSHGRFMSYLKGGES